MANNHHPRKSGPRGLELINSFDYRIFHDDMGNEANVSLLVRAWSALLLDSPTDNKVPNRYLRKFYQAFVGRYSDRVQELSELGDTLARTPVRDDFGDFTPSLHRLVLQKCPALLDRKSVV